MKKLAPSILAADFTRLGEQIAEAEKASADELHIDVMDGMFVPSISFGIPVIQSIRKSTSLFFDVHLMIMEPMRFINEFVQAGANGITVHAEACKYLQETLKSIREHKMRVGVSIKPDTPISVLFDIEKLVDRVLIMTVEPGFGGQKLIPSCVEKVKEIAEHREKVHGHYDIEVDGGIDEHTISMVSQAGAEVFVAGTAVFHGNIGENVSKLKEALSFAD